MNDALAVDASALREDVKAKSRAVAVDPHGSYHFHTGRRLSRRLGYDEAVVAKLPDSAVEAFAGVGNPPNCRTARSRHLPVSEIHSRWATWNLASGSSISGPAAVSTASLPQGR
jgi:hypothetical protein